MIKGYSEWINESTEKPKLTHMQVKWCNKHIDQQWWMNDRGEVEVSDSVYIRPSKIVKFPVQFADVKGYFDCTNCKNLTTLKGAHRKVGGVFSCYGCTSLTSLEGTPLKVGDDFNCEYCTSLTSLEGAPSYVGGGFSISRCISLTSLRGAPSHIKGDIWYANCPKVPQEEIDLYENTPDLFFDWLKTGLSLEEYRTKYSAKIKGNKFGL